MKPNLQYDSKKMQKLKWVREMKNEPVN